jgi:hypothetical protein
MEFFICHFILHTRKHEDLRQTDEALLQNVQYQDCPRQLNRYDCGLFAVGIILHLVEGKDIGTETFTQEHITNLWSELVTVFASDDGTASETTSRVVHSCFPQLNGSSILDSFGVEVVSKKKEVPVAKVLSVTKRRLRSNSVDEVIILSPVPDKKFPVANVLSVTKRWLRSDGVNEVIMLSPVPDKKVEPAKVSSVTNLRLRSNGGVDKNVASTVPGKKVLPVTNAISTKRRLRSDSDLSAAVTVMAELANMAEEEESQMKGTDSVLADITDDTETEATDDKEDAEHGDHDDDEYDNVTESLTAESAACERMQGSSTDSLTDRQLYDILNDANIECFSTLEEAFPLIEQYNIQSGNH